MRSLEMKRIRTLSLALLTAPFSNAVWAAPQIACISPTEYESVSKIYADLFPKYDLVTVAQEFLDVINETQDLKERVGACQKNLDKPDLQRCDPLVKQYDAKRIQQQAMNDRFEAAKDMENYLSTLKLKLERPRCER
jgi:hypothetical protein